MIGKISLLNTTNIIAVNIVQNVSDLSDATHQTEYQTSLTRTIIVFDQNTNKTSLSKSSIERERIEIFAIWMKTKREKRKK